MSSLYQQRIRLIATEMYLLQTRTNVFAQLDHKQGLDGR